MAGIGLYPGIHLSITVFKIIQDMVQDRSQQLILEKATVHLYVK